jgi:hypothetical protein
VFGVLAPTAYGQKLLKEAMPGMSVLVQSPRVSQTVALPFSAVYQEEGTLFYGFEVPDLPVFLPTILGPNIRIYPNPFIAQFTVAISREFSNYEVRLYTTTGREIPSTVWRNDQSLTVQPRVFERGLLIAMMYIDGVLYAKNVVAQ